MELGRRLRMSDTDKDVLKAVLELCEKGINQAQKEAMNSVGTAESFANGQAVAYVKVVELIMSMKQEVVLDDKEAWDSLVNTKHTKAIKEEWGNK
jgi:phage-related minor tail protein